MEITPDIIEGSSISEGQDGYTANRIFFIDGLVGNTTEKGYKALQLKDIPKRGDPHPSVPGIFCQTRDCNAEGVGQVKITCTYKSPTSQEQPASENSPAEMSVGSTIQTETTNVDVDSALLQVKYKKVDYNTDGTPQEPVEVPQNGEASVQIPQTVVRFSRREPFSPIDNALFYTGCINRGEFMGQPEGTWMCIRIDGVSTDGGKTFNVTYEFQFRPQGWRALIVYIDPDTNKVPDEPRSPIKITDAESGNGFARFDMYYKENFSDLNLF